MFKISLATRGSLLCARKAGFKLLRYAKAEGIPATLYKRTKGTWREVAEVTPW